MRIGGVKTRYIFAVVGKERKYVKIDLWKVISKQTDYGIKDLKEMAVDDKIELQLTNMEEIK